jgi:hypothetical protein
MPVLICLSQALRLKESIVHSMQTLLLGFREQGKVLDVKKMINDEPHRFVGSHPMLSVKASQIYGKGIAT